VIRTRNKKSQKKTESKERKDDVEAHWATSKAREAVSLAGAACNGRSSPHSLQMVWDLGVSGWFIIMGNYYLLMG